jgi:hypothetical protein
MYDTHQKGELLKLRGRFRGAVDDRAGKVHERVDEERAEIFNDEDSPP